MYINGDKTCSTNPNFKIYKQQKIWEKMANSFKNREIAQTLGLKDLRLKRPQDIPDLGESLNRLQIHILE
jgi:hypothetical protein